MREQLYTIGHSTHAAEALIGLLERHHIAAVADVRSSPYSRMNPQFNRETLTDTLDEKGLKYIFLGKELGARAEDPSCYVDGRAEYDLIAKTGLFQEGLARVARGVETHRVALMCAEKDPLTCHRTILVCRHLVDRGIEVQHILASGELESHEEAIKRLLAELRMPEQDLFRSNDDIVDEAYRQRGQRIAYTTKKPPTGRTSGARQ
jgi:uncharacterized protein (DUF488 family)